MLDIDFKGVSNGMGREGIAGQLVDEKEDSANIPLVYNCMMIL